MSEAAGRVGSGRKRSRSPTPSSPSPSKKKAITLRALAALESDSSSDSEDERDAKDYEHVERTEPSAAVSAPVSERLNREESPSQTVSRNNNLNEDIVPSQERSIASSSNKIDNINDSQMKNGDGGKAEDNGKVRSNSNEGLGASHDAELKTSGLEDATSKQGHEATNEHDQSPKNQHIPPQVDEKKSSGLIEEATEFEVADEGSGSGKQTSKEAHVNETESSGMRGEAIVFDAADEGAEKNTMSDEDAVCPHAPTNGYSYILSSFLSTPFDDKAMLSLHKVKEAKDPEKKKKMMGRRGSFQRWALSHNDYVPIIPQKVFLKSMRGKQRAKALDQESLRNGINQENNPISSAAISAEVTSFLMQEGQNLLKSPLLSIIAPMVSNQQQQSIRNQASSQPLQPTQQVQTNLLHAQQAQTQPQQPTHQVQTHRLQSQQAQIQQTQFQQPTQQSQFQQPQQFQQSQISLQPQLQQQQLFQQQQIQQQQIHTRQLFRNQTHHLQTPHHFGFTQNQHSYYRMPMANAYQQPQLQHHQYQQAYAAPAFPLASVQNAYNNAAASAVAQALRSVPTQAPAPTSHAVQNSNYLTKNTPSTTIQPQFNAPQPTPKVATTSHEIKLTNSNRDHIGKFPVAFGFWLDDLASKTSARKAAKEWVSQGKNAAKGSATKAKNTASPDSSAVSGTPTTPRTPAKLLSSEAVPSLPPGWMSKTFQRTSGKTAGTKDSYFYSPQNNIKFRSMKGCKTFIEIMNEPEIGGSEATAYKIYKERGHKF